MVTPQRIQRQSRAKLLVYPDRCQVVNDSGTEWVFDSCSIARADAFVKAPASTSWLRKLPRAKLRELLTEARHQHTQLPVKELARYRYESYGAMGDETAVLISAGGRAMMVIRSRLWDGWLASGAQPRITYSGRVAWFNPNGALIGLTMGLDPEVITPAREASVVVSHPQDTP